MVSLGATWDSFPGRMRRGTCLGEGKRRREGKGAGGKRRRSFGATHLRRRYLAASVWTGDRAVPLWLITLFLAFKHDQRCPAEPCKGGTQKPTHAGKD